MRGIHVWAAGAIVVLAAAAAVLWLVVSPGWAIQAAQDQLRQQLGRNLTVRDGAHLEFSPLSVVLGEANISAFEEQDDAFIAAKAIRFPVTVGQLLSRKLDFSSAAIEDADIGLIVNERGQASWSTKAPPQPKSFSLRMINSSLRYYDARNQQAIAADHVNARADIAADGQIEFAGTAVLKGRLARFEMSLKSLARVHGDGSPLATTVETPEFNADFDGRIATAKVLSLAGPVNLTIPNLGEMTRWTGFAIGEGAKPMRLAISGGLDSAGRALAIREATMTLDGTVLSGDVTLDARNAIPKLQGRLSAAALDLARYLPGSGAKPGEWGTAQLGFGLFRAFDAEMTLDTPALSFGPITNAPARLVATAAGGQMKSSLKVQPVNDAQMSLEFNVDAKSAPPAFQFNITSEGVAADLVLPALSGVNWITGSGILQAKLSGAGETQQEMIGTLKGTGSFALTNGSLLGLDIAKTLDSASQNIVEGWAPDAKAATPFRRVSGGFTIADGIAALDNFKLASPALDVSAGGDIDLLRRAVDLWADPKLITSPEGTAAGLPVKLAVKGPWAAPRIYPDIDGMLKDPKQAFQKLRAMGVTSDN